MHRISIFNCAGFNKTETGLTLKVNSIAENLSRQFEITKINIESGKLTYPAYSNQKRGRISDHRIITKFTKPIHAISLAGFYGLRQHYTSKFCQLPENAKNEVTDSGILQVEEPFLFEFASRYKRETQKMVLMEHNFETELCNEIIEREKKIRSKVGKKFFYAPA